MASCANCGRRLPKQSRYCPECGQPVGDGVAADSFATRGRATKRILALRRELRKLAVLRGRLLFELGDAVYREDEQATQAARQRLTDLDEAWRGREAEMQTVIAQAQDR